MASSRSITGRGANFGSTKLAGISRVVTRFHARLYARYGGRRFTKWLGKPAFRLIVRGRKTGELRPVMLMLIRRGDDLLVCGSNAGNPEAPNWWKNLVTAGEAEVQVGPDQWPVTARVVTDPDERAECWKLLVAGYPDFTTYEQLTERQMPIAVLERR
jgi:deazaflavin-dependent oxidoreductase (nitroreductase family)